MFDTFIKWLSSLPDIISTWISQISLIFSDSIGERLSALGVDNSIISALGDFANLSIFSVLFGSMLGALLIFAIVKFILDIIL